MLSLLLLIVGIGAADTNTTAAKKLLFSNATAARPEFSPQWVHKCGGNILSFIPGGGYDLLYGSPMAEGQDPGYKGGYVFDYTFNDCDKTHDGMWLVPDGSYVTVQTISECSSSSASRDMYNSASYQSACQSKVSVDVSASGFMASASFSASAEFKSAHETFSKQNSVVMSSSQYCKTYLGSATWRVAVQKVLSQEYIQAVVQSYIQQNFRSFFSQFGTHMTNMITLGGRAVQSSKFEMHSFQEAESSESNLQAGAKFSYGAVAGGVKASTSTQQQQKNFFENHASDRHLMYVGGFIPKPFDNLSGYKEAVRSSPAPLQTSLVDHIDIFRAGWDSFSKYIPDLNTLIYRYNASLYDYCVQSQFGCRIIQERQGLPKPSYINWPWMSWSDLSGVYVVTTGRVKTSQDVVANKLANWGFASSLKISKIYLTCADPYHGYIYSFQFEYSDGFTTYIGPKIGTCCDGDSKYNKTNLGHTSYSWTVSPSQRITQIQTWATDDYHGHGTPKWWPNPALMKINFCITTAGNSPDCGYGCGKLFGDEYLRTWNVPQDYRFLTYDTQYGPVSDTAHDGNQVTAVNTVRWYAHKLEYP